MDKKPGDSCLKKEFDESINSGKSIFDFIQEKNAEYVALNKELLQVNKKLRQASEKLFQSELNLREQYEESEAQKKELLQINEELQSLTRKLAESNERNSALVEANPDLMFVFDRDGAFLDYHTTNPQSLLLRPEEFLNKNINEVFPGYLADITMHAITQLFETGEAHGYSYSIEGNGKKKHLEARMVKYGNNNALAIVRDLTDQKIAEEKLRQSQKTYLGIINSVSESIYVQDENGIFLEVNDAAIASYGLKREEIIGQSPEILSAAGKNDLALMAEMIKKAFNGKPQRFEFWGRKSDGTVFPDEVTLINGVYFGKSVVIALARNISERKLAEETLKQSEQRFQLSMDATTDGLWDWNVKTDEAYFSPAYFAMLGYQIGEFPETGKSWKKLMHPEDKEIALQKISECIDGIANGFELEFRLRTKNGDWLWMLTRGKCVERDKMGKAKRVVGTHVNMNDRKNAENEILKRELLLNKVFDVLPIGLWFTDENGKILRGNPAGVKIWGTEPTVAIDEYSVFKARRLPSGKEIAPTEWALAQTISKGETITGELIEIDAFDGQKRIILNYTAPVLDNQGTLLGAIVVNNDITELHRAEEDLRESEIRFRGLYENATVGIYRTTPDGKIVMANPTLVKMLGYDSFDDLKKRNLSSEGYDPDYPRDDFQKEIARNGRVHAFESKWKVKDGSIIYISESSRMVCDEQGKPMFYEGMVEDITERKRSEFVIEARIKLIEYAEKHSLPEFLRETLREAEKLTNSQIGFYHFIDEENGNVILNEWSESTQVLCNVTHDFVKQYPINEAGAWVECIHARKPVIHNEYDKLHQKKGLPWGPARVIRESSVPVIRNKQIKAVLGIGNKQTNYDKNDIEIISQLADLAWDIAEKKLVEEQLQKLSKGIEQSPAIVIITDTKGNIEFINPIFTEVTGYSFDEVGGQNPRILKSGRQDSKFYQHLWDTILSGNDWKGELLNKKKNGELYWEHALISPIKNERGKVINFISIKENITEKKKAEEALKASSISLKKKNEELTESNQRIIRINKELIAAREKAEESDKLKTAFLANMSHEIRTPMNGILGFAKLLKNPKLTGNEQKTYIRIIEKSGVRMLNIINDIINISKIEAGLVNLDIKETNINEQIEYIYTFFKPEVEAKGMNMVLKTTLTAQEAVIKTDREKVYAILTNLVKNAIKYSKDGTIEIGCTKRDNNLEFYVKDEGIGIPKARQEAIFERFIQADIADKMAHQGAGLGLSITKGYIEMLGGKIWVESEEEIGSTFYLTLPYNAYPVKETVAKQFESSKITDQVGKLKILIAEDDEVSEMLLNEELRTIGKEILIARTGVDAVESCRNNHDIDLVLMDIRMPEMNGYEATRQIREFNKEVVIIAQTAYGLSGDRKKAIEAGCNDYIAKPIKIAELLLFIHKYFGK